MKYIILLSYILFILIVIIWSVHLNDTCKKENFDNSNSFPTGGTITNYTLGGVTYNIHTFTSSSQFIVPSNITCDILVVGAGGGATGWGGAGGGGDVKYYSSQKLTTGSYPIVVGNGGGGVSGHTENAGDGTFSQFGNLDAANAGKGGYWNGQGGNSGNNNKGTDYADNNPISGAGAGAGGSLPIGSPNTTGGPGISNSITGTSVMYGLGGSHFINTPPIQNTGNGGNGGTSGANGVVIIRYITNPSWTTVYSDNPRIDLGASATDALFNQSKVFRRLCKTCDAEHTEIYYKRITPIPSGWSVYNNMKTVWASANNIINIDFKLYSTYSDLINDTNPWAFCNYDDFGNLIGFPRDCGKSDGVGFQWTSTAQNSTRTNFSYDVLNINNQSAVASASWNYNQQQVATAAQLAAQQAAAQLAAQQAAAQLAAQQAAKAAADQAAALAAQQAAAQLAAQQAAALAAQQAAALAAQQAAAKLAAEQAAQAQASASFNYNQLLAAQAAAANQIRAANEAAASASFNYNQELQYTAHQLFLQQQAAKQAAEQAALKTKILSDSTQIQTIENSILNNTNLSDQTSINLLYQQEQNVIALKDLINI